MPTEQTFGSSPSAKRCHGTCAHPPRSASCACCARAPSVHLSPASRHLLLHVGAGLRGLFPAGISSALEQKSCGRRSVQWGRLGPAAAAWKPYICAPGRTMQRCPPCSGSMFPAPSCSGRASLEGSGRWEEAAASPGAWQLRGAPAASRGRARVECEVHAPPAAQAGSTLNVGLTDVPSDRAESHVTAWLEPT